MVVPSAVIRPFEVTLPFVVKTYDIDFSGVVSNTVYVRWLEDLRLELLQTYFPLEKQLEKGFAPVLLQTRIDYKKPVKLFDKPIGRLWMHALGKIKWTVAAEITAGGNIVTAAEQTGIFVSTSRWRPIPIPKEFAEKYQEFLKHQS